MIRLIDSFAHYTNLAKWDSSFFGGVNPTGGRFAGSGSAGGELIKVLPMVVSQTKCITGFAYTGNAATILDVSGVMTHGNPNDNTSAPSGSGSFFDLNYVGDGTFYCWAGGWTGSYGSYAHGGTNGALFYGPGGIPIAENSWHYYEVQIDLTNMAVEVHINGESVYSHSFGYSLPGLQVWATRLPHPAVDKYGSYCDFVILDDVASPDPACPNNTFLGDIRVAPLWPRVDGYHLDWVQSTGATHYTTVDETVENDDTDTVSTPTVGAIDTYLYQPCTLIGDVLAVQQNLWSKKVDAGSHDISALCRISSTDYVNSTSNSLTLDYHDNRGIWDVNPATGLQWSTSEIDSTEFGMKLTS